MSLTDGIINTVFLTFLHNQYAIAFLLGAILSLIALLIKPSRYFVLLLIGFLTLLLGFEYNKHIIEPLQDQTLTSLGLEDGGGSAGTLVIRTFQKLLPILFFTIGWGSIFIAIFAKAFKREPQINS
jgi:hypothetical protein